MKKLILILLIGLTTGALYGQSWLKKGVKVGKKASVVTIKDITSDGSDVKIFDASGDTLNPYVPYANKLDAANYFPLLHPDTLAITDDYTLVLTDDGKRIRVNKATGMIITLPPHSSVAFIKESTIYIQQLGAGPIIFQAGAGVTIVSELDSIALNTQYRWAAIIYWGNDNYQLIGTTD